MKPVASRVSGLFVFGRWFEPDGRPTPGAERRLEKAVELAPEFPDNHLCYMEALAKWSDWKTLGESEDLAEWGALHAINLQTCVTASKAVLPWLQRRGAGRKRGGVDARIGIAGFLEDPAIGVIGAGQLLLGAGLDAAVLEQPRAEAVRGQWPMRSANGWRT